ncbi:ABC transporter ATP-binding protein [Natrarchaeobius halalkaliphilus]|uniref:ABC transporter ATP-binding protein n=1 Tax=Natrarchaeobius halalkaliphilus TaxID=1679091 RepID=A0A3N6LIP5_9EURY|nr:ABC transporter ATP-binding protein [Natrarchaeobius halalkaliphilus]RQG87806.1 ABC transporter ATP-binding protein [Natrarchaeobius halalkaliphilus]
MSLVNIDGVSVEYRTDNGPLTAVDDVSFTIEEGETLGIVGESGCGKTTMTKAFLRLLDNNGEISTGSITYDGIDLATVSEEQLRTDIRWKEISYIPQNAMAALDPVYTVGAQVVQVIELHTDNSTEQARERCAELFKRVDLDPNRMGDYPHELSGGQRQRVTIALSLALSPSLIVADEPTTGLDVIVQDQICELLAEIQDDIGCAIVFVTHDMGVVSNISDRVAVMYAGRIAEIGTIDDVFDRSAHPYTIGLQNAFPRMDEFPASSALIEIPGSPPNLLDPPTGCRFEGRCPYATEECRHTDPSSVELEDGHRIECLYPERRSEFREHGNEPDTWKDAREAEAKQTP